MQLFQETETGFLMNDRVALEHFGFMPEPGDTVTFDGHEYVCVESFGDTLMFVAL